MNSTASQIKPSETIDIFRYTVEENKIWNELYFNQLKRLRGFVPAEYLDGVKRLELTTESVPQVKNLNGHLKDVTGMKFIPVTNVSQPREFFGYLARREFPVRTHLRQRHEMDSVDWPDIYHEVFGHGPFLANESYADFLEKYGKLGLSVDPSLYWHVFRLFWYTAEFGLIKKKDSVEFYGAGIISCVSEVEYLKAGSGEIRRFDTLDVLRSPYKIKFPQPLFYFIEDFSELSSVIDDNIMELLEKARELGDLQPL